MKFKDIYMFVLGGLVVIGFFTILYIVFKVELPGGNKDIALILLGVLGAKFGDVVSYFYGSSKGSTDKTEMIHNSTPKS